jgi:hypothetical protein
MNNLPLNETVQSNKYFAKRHRLGQQISPSPLTKYLDRSIKAENLNKTFEYSPPNQCTPRRYGVKAKIYDFKEVNKFFRPTNLYKDTINTTNSNEDDKAEFDNLVMAHEKSFANPSSNPPLSNCQDQRDQSSGGQPGSSHNVLNQSTPKAGAPIIGSPKFRRRLQQKHRLFVQEDESAKAAERAHKKGDNLDDNSKPIYRVKSRSPERKFEVPSTFTSINIR